MDNNTLNAPINETTAAKSKPRSGFLMDVIEVFAGSLAAIIIIMTFCLRVCTVDGHSMDHTLAHGETLLIFSLGYEPTENDIIVFQDTDLRKAVVKRLIATGNKWVKIDYDNSLLYVSKDNIFTEDEIIDESAYVYFDIGSYKQTGELIKYVPEGFLFVLGDNRNGSNDSRGSIGLVNEKLILGKVIIRVSPSEKFEPVK